MYKTLVISGGSIRGVSALGALHELRTKNSNLLSSIENYVGVSVGSLIVTLLVMGMTEDVIFEEFIDVDVGKMLNISLMSFMNEMGLDDGKKMMNFVQEKFTKLGFSPVITLEQLHRITNKDLNILAVNIDKSTEHIFSHRSDPKCMVIDAVRMSCGIPFYFTTWTYNGDRFVDGAAMNNFPLSYATKLCPDDMTLGIVMRVTPDAPDCGRVKDFLDYVGRLVDLVTSDKQRIQYDITNCDILVVSIVEKYSITNLTKAAKLDLFQMGIDCTKNFLLQKNEN